MKKFIFIFSFCTLSAMQNDQINKLAIVLNNIMEQIVNISELSLEEALNEDVIKQYSKLKNELISKFKESEIAEKRDFIRECLLDKSRILIIKSWIDLNVFNEEITNEFESIINHVSHS